MSRPKENTGDAPGVKAFPVADMEIWVRAIADRAVRSVVPVPSHPFTQYLRPWWAPTRSLYLAAWRELEASGHTGVTAVGRVRGMTAEAAEFYAATHAPKKRDVPTAPISGSRSIDDEELEALGARKVGGTR